MPADNDSEAPRRRDWRRVLAIALALAAAAWIVFGWRAAQHDRAALAGRAEALGIQGGLRKSLVAELARESDPAERRLALARTLLATAIGAGGAADPGQVTAQLESARELARQALAQLPASSEGAMITGAATELLRLRARDTRLFSAYRDWEAPLEAARARAPGAAEPRRLLAAAYLEVWPALSPDKRRTVEPLLREAFTDRDFFDRMFGRWVAIAGSTERAAALLPDTALTWQRLFEVAARGGDLERAAELYRHARQSLLAELRAELDPERLAAAPDPVRATTEVVVRAPVERSFVPIVERAIGERPAGLVPPALAVATVKWIEWARPLCLVTGCPLAPETLARMASSAGGGLPPDQAAFVALAAGERPRAEMLARRSDALWSELWAPYLELSARLDLDGGETGRACDELGQVHRFVRGRPAWRILARACPPLAAAAAADDPDPLERDQWNPADWVWSHGQPELELVAARAAAALEIDFQAAAARPALVVAEWDGAELPPLVVEPGALEIVLPVAVTPGIHLLRLSSRAGPLPPPGAAALAPAPVR